VYLEDLVADLLKTLKPDEMAWRQQLEEFRAKYLPFVKNCSPKQSVRE
jgi:hypothetical protein